MDEISGKNMMPILAVICILIIPEIVGRAFVPSSLPNPFRWLIGLYGIGMYWLIGYSLSLPKPAVMAGFVAVLMFCCITLRLRKIRVPSGPELFIYGILCVLLIWSVTDIYANPITDWDGFAIWLQKAKDFYYWVPLNSLTFVQYPGLGSMWWSLLLTVFGFHESYGRFVYPVIFLQGIAGIWQSLKLPKAAPEYSAVLIALLLFFFRRSMFNGYQDDLLAITAALAAFLFIRAFRSPLPEPYYVAACFFAGSLGLIKNEGILIGLILVATYHVIQHNAARMRGLIVFVVLSGFWSVVLVIHGIDPRNVQGDQINLNTIINGYRHFERLPVISQYLMRYTWGHAFYALIGLGSAAAAFAYPAVRKGVIFIWGVIAVHIAGVIWIFLATAAPLTWHLDTAFDRLMDQHAMLYLLLALLSVPLVISPKQRHNPWV